MEVSKTMTNATLAPFEPPPLPDHRYGLVYADPPWTYNDKAKAGERGAEFQYPCLTVDELADIDVPSICREDCMLAMWWTPPLAREALDLMDRWGFQLITMKGFTWHKLTKRGFSFFGMGNWTRANTEDVLFARRGRPARIASDVRQFVETYKPDTHSRKPHEVRVRLERLLSDDLPRIELFARQSVPGWTTWGAEAPLPPITPEEIRMTTNTRTDRAVQATHLYEYSAAILKALSQYFRSPVSDSRKVVASCLASYQDAWVKARTQDENGEAADGLNAALLAAVDKLGEQALDGTLLDADYITPEVSDMLTRIQSKYRDDDDDYNPRK